MCFKKIFLSSHVQILCQNGTLVYRNIQQVKSLSWIDEEKNNKIKRVTTCRYILSLLKIALWSMITVLGLMTVLVVSLSSFVRFSPSLQFSVNWVLWIFAGNVTFLVFPCCYSRKHSRQTYFLNCRAESSCVGIMASFLRYLYCEPYQLREYAELRMGLLKILLQPHGPKHEEAPSTLECEILQLLCDLVPHLQVQLLPDLTFYKQVLPKQQ